MKRTAAAVRAGFTLIELLAVILIITLLVATLTPMVTSAIERARVTACNANLREIYKGLMLYNMKFGSMPAQSGVKFFASLISREAWENTKSNAERLTCPGVEKSALTIGREQIPWEEWWTDLEKIDGGYSAYAGRDMKNHPLRQGITSSGKEPLIADDNDGGMNHHTTTNVLYADGNVQTFELPLLREEGKIDKEEKVLLVGPSSPVPDLTKLTLD